MKLDLTKNEKMLKILVIIQTQNEFTDVSLCTHFFRYLYRNKNKLSATVNDKLIHVQVGDEEIKATPTHPFWVIGLGWVNAGDLQVGDKILLSSGQTEAIDEITEELLKEPINVYNFEVEDWHTYFVSEKNILVHNTCSKPVNNKKNNAVNKPANLSPQNSGRKGAFREAKRKNGVPVSEQPKSVKPNFDKRGKQQAGRIYEFENGVKIRDDAGGHIFNDNPIQNRGPHFNDPYGNHYDY